MGGISGARNKRKYSYHCRQMNLFFVPVDAFRLNCQPFLIPGLYLVLSVLSNTLYPRMNRTDNSLDRGRRYDEYDSRHRLKVRKDDDLTASARARPTFTSSYPSSTTTSSRDSAMSSSRDSTTSASRRRNQEITQV